MIATWPSELPRPDREGWQLRRQDGRQKRQSDAGPPTWRRRFSSVAQIVNMQLLLDRNQREIFDRFYIEDLSEGTGLFWMPDPTTDGWPILDDAGRPVLDDAGEPLLMSARWLCSFGDSTPVETIVGLHFRKQIEIVVLP